MKKLLLITLISSNISSLFSSDATAATAMAASQQSRYGFLKHKADTASTKEEKEWYEGLIINEKLSDQHRQNQAITLPNITRQQRIATILYDQLNASPNDKKPAMRELIHAQLSQNMARFAQDPDNQEELSHQAKIARLKQQIDYLRRNVIFNDNPQLRQRLVIDLQKPHWEQTIQNHVMQNGATGMVLPKSAQPMIERYLKQLQKDVDFLVDPNLAIECELLEADIAVTQLETDIMTEIIKEYRQCTQSIEQRDQRQQFVRNETNIRQQLETEQRRTKRTIRAEFASPPARSWKNVVAGKNNTQEAL